LTTLLLITLALMVLAGVWTVMSRSLVAGAVSLGLASLLLSVVLFFFAAPLAAVFELSVCAGLVTVVFISTIALTEQQSRAEMMEATKLRIERYWPLPAVLLVVGALALAFGLTDAPTTATVMGKETLGSLLWTDRSMDVFGQMAILLAGVLGIVVLFKQGRKA